MDDRPLLVLVVDDRADDARMLVAMLGTRGHDARAVHDGEQAVAAAARLKPDVALLDLTLPVLDGVGAARAIRVLPGLESCVLAAVSGLDADPLAGPVPFQRHFLKPLDFDALFAFLDDVKRGRRPNLPAA